MNNYKPLIAGIVAVAPVLLANLFKKKLRTGSLFYTNIIFLAFIAVFYIFSYSNPDLKIKWKKSHPKCGKCSSSKPVLVNHCNTCNQCRYRLDHHCQWANVCVAYGNLRCYVSTLTWGSAYCVSLIWLCVKLIWSNLIKMRVAPLAYAFIIIVLASILLYRVIGLLYDQVLNLSYNQTVLETYRSIESRPEGFWHGARRRLGGFLLLWPWSQLDQWGEQLEAQNE